MFEDPHRGEILCPLTSYMTCMCTNGCHLHISAKKYHKNGAVPGTSDKQTQPMQSILGRCLHSCVRVEFQPEQAAVRIINTRITGAPKGSPHIFTTLSPCTGMSNVITMLSILNRKRHHFIKWRTPIFHLKACIKVNYHRILGNMVCSSLIEFQDIWHVKKTPLFLIISGQFRNDWRILWEMARV